MVDLQPHWQEAGEGQGQEPSTWLVPTSLEPTDYVLWCYCMYASMKNWTNCCGEVLPWEVLPTESEPFADL